MAFILRVQFTGLCVHVQHPTRPEVAVLMPDARALDPTNGMHLDFEPAVPHVGFLRFDLANLVAIGDRDAYGPRGWDAPGVSNPTFEVVRRVERKALDFGLGAATRMSVENDLPDQRAFAPILSPIDGLFDTPATAALLFRTVLRGGRVESTDDPRGITWQIDGRVTGAPSGTVEGTFPSLVTWTREVDAESLTLTLADLDGSGETSCIRLHPIPDPHRVPTISLKLSNLCGENPLEWPEYRTRDVVEDRDFKWLYRLFRPTRPGGWRQLLGTIHKLPIPVRGHGITAHDDCFGLRTSFDFPELA